MRAAWYALLCAGGATAAFNRVVIPSPAYDTLYLVPSAAALCAAVVVVRLHRTEGLASGFGFLRRLTTTTVGRASVLVVLLIAGSEFGLRVLSLHRTLRYERQGDLLFTPVPNQEYLEKLSLSPDRVNGYGLRGPDVVQTRRNRRTILCLGDSITYGYGLAGRDAYPAQLGQLLERQYPGEYLVLNGGVNAYPLSFVHQKFLYLWRIGVRPDVVLIGYSMNEGWLGRLASATEAEKAAFESRVRLKNVLRGFALYNLVVENWARAHYDRLKAHLVPGTHVTELSDERLEEEYTASLSRLVTDVRSRNVELAFVAFAAWDGKARSYVTTGPLQTRFVEFAGQHGIRCVRVDEVLTRARSAASLEVFFLDYGHMNAGGNAVLAEHLAEVLVPE